jgi:hypothetical protein
MLNVVKGNLLDATEKYIGHQCNAVSTYAAGVAKDIFNTYTHSDIYRARQHPDMPGHIVVCGDGVKTRLVINLVAQYNPGAPTPNSLLDSEMMREGYFWQCLMAIKRMADVESIALPDRVGCGLAKGNWEHYYHMLENFDAIINEYQKVAIRLYRL